jgi:hypothetical protein
MAMTLTQALFTRNFVAITLLGIHSVKEACFCQCLEKMIPYTVYCTCEGMMIIGGQNRY